MSTQAQKTAAGEKILDEETYEAALDAIIQRDFFPELPELDTQIQWLQAEQNHDHETMRKLSHKLRIQSHHRSIRSTPISSSVRSSSRTPKTSSTSTRIPSTTSTPTPLSSRSGGGGGGGRTPNTPQSKGSRSRGIPSSSTPNNTSSHNPFPGQDEFLEEEDKATQSEYATNGLLQTPDGKSVNITLSLDKFHDRHTSEDNASFSELLCKLNQQRREKYSWLSDKLFLTSRNQGQLLLTTTVREASAGNGPDKEILHPSTRMPPPPINLLKSSQLSSSSSSSSQELFSSSTYFPLNSSEAQILAQRRLKDEGDHLDIDEVFKTPNSRLMGGMSSPQVRGYSFVSPIASPSPDFDGSMSPFMTWGSVDGTPLLISALTSNDPADLIDGPTYKLQETSSREKLALDLVEKATVKKAKTPVRFSPVRGGITKKSPLLSPSIRNLIQTKQRTTTTTPFTSLSSRMNTRSSSSSSSSSSLSSRSIAPTTATTTTTTTASASTSTGKSPVSPYLRVLK